MVGVDLDALDQFIHQGPPFGFRGLLPHVVDIEVLKESGDILEPLRHGVCPLPLQ
jgi:hypothetical protein